MAPELYLFLSWARKDYSRLRHLQTGDAVICAEAFLGVSSTPVSYDVRKQHLSVLALVNEYKLSNQHP